MSRSMILASTVGVFLLAGCAGNELGNAEKTAATGSDFEKTLYSEYVALSKSEFAEGDYRDSDKFALRAISAAKGKPTEPEALEARRLPASASGALSNARGRLVAALAGGAAAKAPKDAAHAQAMFDCWMQEQEENFQPNDISRCRADFLAAMTKLEGMAKPVHAAAAAPAPMAPKRMREDFVVYFGFDSTSPAADSAAMVTRAIGAAKQMGAKTVLLQGHTDRAGSDKYNEILSLRRVRMVADEFTSAGIKPTIITTQAFGEKFPAVATKDGVREQKNRRVVIQIGN